MNRTKRNLIIAAIVFNFIFAFGELALLIAALTLPNVGPVSVFEIVYFGIDFAVLCIANGLLIYAIAGKGQSFNSRRGFYTAGVIMTVFLAGFSVASILLIISLFTSDIVWVKPVDDVYFGQGEEQPQQPAPKTNKEKEIALLRKKREQGLISEEEYNKELFKLL